MRDTSARSRRAARLALVALTARLTLTACGDDDDALVCSLSDRRGGPPHMARGMVVEATVE